MTDSETVTLPILRSIDELLVAFEQHGISVDIDQRANVIKLIVELINSGSLPQDLGKLSTLITPIVARSPADQAACISVFHEFAKRESHATNRVGESTREDESPSRLIRLLTNRSRLLLAIASLTLILSIALFFWLGNAPMPDQRMDASSDASWGGSLVSDESLEWLLKFPFDAVKAPEQRPWNRSIRWFYAELDHAKWAALLAPLVLFIGLVAFLLHRLVAALHREALRRALNKLTWQFPKVNTGFGDRRLISDLQPLRRLASDYVRLIDIERTVSASAASAGLFQPRFLEKGIAINYVVYLDRQSARDHLALYNLEVVQTLRDAGLSVELFEYNRTLSVCYDVREDVSSSLESTIRRFPDGIHLVFASSLDQLLDPVRNRLATAVSALKSAKKVVVIVPEGDDVLRMGEIRLESLSLIIVPTTQRALRRLAQWLTGDIEVPKGRDALILNNEIGSSAEASWVGLQEATTGLRYQSNVVEHLRAALGPARLRLLAATAVYPELRWPLTLLLGGLLDGRTEGRVALGSFILSVARLPWFRAGWMPDWTRELLQRRLTRRDREAVQDVLTEAIKFQSSRYPRGLESGSADVVSSGRRRMKADRLTVTYLLPIVSSLSQYFPLPRSEARRIARKPLYQFVFALILGGMVLSSVSAASLALLPINSCDLLAASDMDDLRVGPGHNARAIAVFFGREAAEACVAAVLKEPNNSRLLFQLGRAVAAAGSGDGEEFVLKAANSIPPYPAAVDWLGLKALTSGNKEYEKALVLFKQAVELGNPSSEYHVGLVNRRMGRSKESFDALTHYVAAGGKYVVELARFYPVTRGGAYESTLQMGVSRGDGAAAELLVALNQESLDPASVNELLELAARQSGSSTAAVAVAERYMRRRDWESNRSFEQDVELATQWAAFAAKQGNSQAFDVLRELGTSHRKYFKYGYAPPKQFYAEGEIKRLAEEGGRSKAETGHYQYLWGSLLESKNPYDLSEVISWYKRAAENGNWRAREAFRSVCGEYGKAVRTPNCDDLKK